MAWVSPKVYAILSNSEEGKDILVNIAEKDQETVDKEVDEFFKNGKGKESPEEDDENFSPESISPDEKELIKKRMKNIWQGSRGNKRDESIITRINEEVDKLPNEYSEMITNAMRTTVDNFYQDKGKGFYDPMEKKINIDRYDLFNNEIYHPMNVFFHEVGHSIDRMFGLKTHNFWVSNTYKSEKYGVTLADMILEEASGYDLDAVEKAIAEDDSMSENPRSKRLDELFKERNEADTEWNRCIDEAKTILHDFYDEKLGDIPHKTEFDYANYFREQEAKKAGFEDYYDIPFMNPERGRINKIFEEKVKEYRGFQESLRDTNPEYDLACIKKEKAWERFAKATEDYSKLCSEPCRTYGDCADLIGGAHGQHGVNSVDMGHDSDYWEGEQKRKKHLGLECFAELFAGVTNNKASYYNMKKMFPKSTEIFEEILKKYGN